MDERRLKSKIKNKMSLLKVNNLNISYPTRKETIVASKDVEFNLERGEILGIVGESGSGKSTIANAIINLIDPPGKITGGSIKSMIANLETMKMSFKNIEERRLALFFKTLKHLLILYLK